MDDDLRSIQEARDKIGRAHAAAEELAGLSQEEVDRFVVAMGEAAERAAAKLARSAVDETGMGRYEDKVTKNLFSAVDVREYILPLKTCGVIRDDSERRVTELAVPMGVVAALLPTTNPTSTAIYKALIAVKARNAVVFSPHPRATGCVLETVEILAGATRAAGAPADVVQSMGTPTLEGTNELMSHRLTAVILATGGGPMVRAAYSSGKPAFGVGPGNAPAIVERSADVAQAVEDIVAGKDFDHGLICAAENSLICDAPVERDVRAELTVQRAIFVEGADRDRLERAMKDVRTGGIAGAVIGRPAAEIARRAGLNVPEDTRALVVQCVTVGREEFFSREKLSPVLAFYVEDGWEACCERSIELLRYGGIGHTLALHSNDEQVIERFFVEKPAFRILVNTPAALGAIGATTGLPPALTLGPGAWGGSSTSDNISPMHLLNIKRLAYGARSYRRTGGQTDGGAGSGTPIPPDRPTSGGEDEGRVRIGETPHRRNAIEDEIRKTVAEFLAERRTRRGQ
jgi:acetaldehyde dehydrogenase (acetylating)